MAIYNKLRDLLLEAGLSEAEAAVYIELLKKPDDDIYDLVSRTGLSKSVVYRAFENLLNLKIVERGEKVRALSLKNLVSDLTIRERKARHLAYKIKKIAPFLRDPRDNIETFETYSTPDQISQAYLFMSEADYDTNLDFGDFENFVPYAGGLPISFKFRENRMKHASHHAICTTFGPNTAYFSTREAEKKFKNKVDLLKIDFKKRFIIFSDTGDYVLFNDFSDPEYPCSTLVSTFGSKPLAFRRWRFS